MQVTWGVNGVWGGTNGVPRGRIGWDFGDLVVGVPDAGVLGGAGGGVRGMLIKREVSAHEVRELNQF